MYLFALSIANESIIANNINVFKDFNINELGLNRDNSHFSAFFYSLIRRFEN